ncbi:hypothetical protein HKD37_12G034431 [Glycine soja]
MQYQGHTETAYKPRFLKTKKPKRQQSRTGSILSLLRMLPVATSDSGTEMSLGQQNTLVQASISVSKSSSDSEAISAQVFLANFDIWMGNRALMKGVPKITSFLRKTFFSWGSCMELIASNKRSCSLIRVLICPSSSSVDDSWSSCWIRFRFSSEGSEDEVSVSSSESTIFADVALFSTIVARFSISLLVDGLCEYLLLGNLFVLTGMLEVVSIPWRFTVGNWLCNSDLVSPTGIERVLAEKDLLADSYSDLEASILDEKEFLLLKVISTFPELSCLICSMVGAGRGIDGVALSITHLSGRVTSSHFIFLGRETLAFVISLILRDFWNVPVIHVLIDIFESDFLIEEIVFWGDLLGLFLEEDDEEEFERKEIREKDRNSLLSPHLV